jgi:iron complex transport system substrate-binding protein
VRRLVLCVPVLQTSLRLSACSEEPGVRPASEEPATRTVTHVRGTTEVPADLERVVVLDLGELDSAVALGVTPVGAVKAPVEEGLLSYLEDELAGVALVGEIGEPDLEKIAALEPDLILGSDIRVKDLYDELSAIAPTVVPETVDVTWEENLAVHAEALGEQAEAEELLAAYEERAEEVGEEVADDTTVSVVRLLPGEIPLYGTATVIGTVLEDAGIGRPTAQDVEEFGVDVLRGLISKAEGDVVFRGTHGDPAGTDGPEVPAGPPWKNLTAVEAGAVHEVDDDIWFLGTGVGAADLVLNELEQTLAG